jgi:hypothetical protein
MPTNAAGAKSPTVTVRMYRQGLGDCFLLTFAGGAKPVHVLIDCGVLLGTKDAKVVMTQVAEDIRKTTGGHLDVVVATHEHWDHLSGFTQAEKIFKDQIQMQEIWLAWTEEPGNARAKELRGELALRLAAVTKAVTRWQKSGLQPRLYQGVTEVVSFFGDVLAAGSSTQDALKCLTERKDAEFRYLTPGTEPFALPGVPGVRVYCLGPPSDDKSLSKLLPSKGSEEAYEMRLTPERAFFAALDAGPESKEHRLSFPFDDYYRIPKDQARARADEYFRRHYGFDADPQDEWRRIDDDWLTVAGQLALDLDNKTNNTCLVLAFEIVATGDVLLFPGDAQIGNWASWKRLSFKVKNDGAAATAVTAKDLLTRTVFYKVGHHASHNATHRSEGLELMQSPDLVAMIPVNHEMAKKKGWKMPFDPLLRRLKEKCRGRVIRQDEPVKTTTTAAAKVLTKKEAGRFEDAVRETELYVECRVPL